MSFFKITTPFKSMEENIRNTSHISRLEQKDMDRCFTRLFSSDDGKKAIAWLQVMTFHKVSGAQTSQEQLRYMEGQRALVANILRMIERGKSN